MIIDGLIQYYGLLPAADSGKLAGCNVETVLQHAACTVEGSRQRGLA